MASKPSVKHSGMDTVPFDGVLGVTLDGVPVMSNGDEAHFSNEPSFTPASVGLCSFQKRCPGAEQQRRLGYKWQCVEFVRRYLAARKAVWLMSVPTAEDVWKVEVPFMNMIDDAPAEFIRVSNKSAGPPPQAGDLLVWSRCEEVPFGHIAVVTSVGDDKVQVAEQNHGFEKWSGGQSSSRELVLHRHADGTLELSDEDPILGWISVKAPFYDYSTGDLGDQFRIITGPGTITRRPVEPDCTLPWLRTEERCDYHLKRSLVANGDMGPGAVADVRDVPSAFYYLDYDMWCRIGRAANSLHQIAMDATRQVLESPDATHLLEFYFGVPREIQPLIRRSWELTPPMGGRFDFGYDGKNIVMLEYNCDSSGALLECCDTQEKMAQHYKVQEGQSTGSFLGSKCVNFFLRLKTNEKACPKHHLIHFMIDDDDEERYTAECMMNLAEKAGFRTKLCVKLDDFSFRVGSPVNAAPQTIPCARSPTVVDREDEEVLLVWKTWSWDTVLHQYADQKQQKPTASGVSAKPSLSDILLSNNIRVLEPLWKAITGSKAILPFMHALAPDHLNMLPASFERTQEIISKHHISKPVNGRAGQNIVMYDPVSELSVLHDAPVGSGAANAAVCPSSQSQASPLTGGGVDRTNESSAGRFFDSVLVYQRRLFLKKFENKYFPIFCGWMIGSEFSGVVVREDTSKITKLASVVIPARVLRERDLSDTQAHVET